MIRRNRVKLLVTLVAAIAIGVVITYPVWSPADSGKVAAREVEAIVEKTYQRPQLHTLTAAVENFESEPNFIEWERRYDGVAMSTKVTSLRGPGGWEARWHRELAEPEPVRKRDLISTAQAATNVGLGAAFRKGDVKSRLLYRANFTMPPDAKDGAMVVESYRLVIELQHDEETIYVDAYTGALVKRLGSRMPTAL